MSLYIYKFKCRECGKLSCGRMPRNGDSTVRFPRRHKLKGVLCFGNIMEERVLRIRQRKARIPKPPVSATEERIVGENVISFLQEKDTSPEPERADVRAVFQNIKNNLRSA